MTMDEDRGDDALSLDEVTSFCTRANRVCPAPRLWLDLYEQLGGKAAGAPIPLVLGAWSLTSDRDKRDRFLELLTFANERGRMGEAARFLLRLSSDQWHTVGPLGWDHELAFDVDPELDDDDE